jgi:hypothetical protein
MTITWWNELCEEINPTLRHLRVAVYGSGGAPYHHAGLVALWGGRPEALSAQQIREGALQGVDAIVFPGGGARAMGGMLEPLGTDGARAIRDWVAGGGMYIGSCAGSFLPAAVSRSYWEAHPEAEELHMVKASLANGNDSEWEGLTSPGVGTLEVAVTDREHWLAEGLPERFQLVHYNGPMFLPQAVDATEGAFSMAQGIVRPERSTPHFTPSENFMAFTQHDDTLFDRCVQAGAYVAVTARYGNGTVVLFGSHPEFGLDPMQLGWSEGARMFANALKYQANKRSRRDGNVDQLPAETDIKLRITLEQVSTRLEYIAKRLAVLAVNVPDPWLKDGYVAGFMGRDPQTLWQETLGRATEVSRSTSAYLKCVVAQAPGNLHTAKAWIDTEAVTGQDYGFMGLRQIARLTEDLIDLGEQQLAGEPFCLGHPYDRLLEHPYQILVSSYLSVAGLVACMALSSVTIGAYVDYLKDVPVGPYQQEQPS